MKYLSKIELMYPWFKIFNHSIVILLLAISFKLDSISIEDELVFAFRGHNRIESERMVIVGEIVSIEKAQTLESIPLADLKLDTRPDNVVVKVLNPKAVRLGQTLYLVEKDPDHKKFRNGNIVGQITVRSIFDTTFFGKQLRGEGYTRLIENRPLMVVRPFESADTGEALILKKRGDFHYYRNEIPQAMKFYRQAISMDTKLADAHYALGRVYKDESNGKLSMLAEYTMAWKYREKFSELRERIKFYNDYMEYIYENWENDSKKLASLNRMEDICLESMEIIGPNFESDLFYSWTQYQKLILAKGYPNQESIFFEKSKQYFLNSAKYSRESIIFHEMAILLANEDLGNWTRGRPITDRVNNAITTIRNHGRRLLLINIPGNPISMKIIHILERIPD